MNIQSIIIFLLAISTILVSSTYSLTLTKKNNKPFMKWGVIL